MSDTTPLSDREASFVREYLLSRNQLDAFIKAGYSPKSARANAFRMMDKENIRAVIAREDAKTRQRQTKTLDDLIEEYTKLGFTGMSRFMRIDENGQPVIDLKGCTKADLDLLAEVTIETFMDGKGDAAREVKRIRIKPYDRFKALDKLAQHLGFGADLKPQENPLAALLKEIMDRGSALPVRPQGLAPLKKPWQN